MNTGIWRWISVTPLSVRRAPPVILEDALLHDLGAEPRRGAPQRVGEQLVLVMRADHQQPALPLLPDQILRQRIGQHRARRRDMDDIGAAILPRAAGRRSRRR